MLRGTLAQWGNTRSFWAWQSQLKHYVIPPTHTEERSSSQSGRTHRTPASFTALPLRYPLVPGNLCIAVFGLYRMRTKPAAILGPTDGGGRADPGLRKDGYRQASTSWPFLSTVRRWRSMSRKGKKLKWINVLCKPRTKQDCKLAPCKQNGVQHGQNKLIVFRTRGKWLTLRTAILCLLGMK